MNGRRFARGLCGSGAFLLLCVGATHAQDQGVKQLEKVVGRAGTTVQAITEAQLQLVKTMDVYNALMAQDAKDRKGLYKKLQAEMATLERKRADIRVCAEQMRGESEIMFQSWTDSLRNIESADLRKRSEERQAKTRAGLSEIDTTGQRAAELYEPLIKTLRDHVAYLAHDLTPPAIVSLEPDAAKLNVQVLDLSKKMDDTVSIANATVATMRP